MSPAPGQEQAGGPAAGAPRAGAAGRRARSWWPAAFIAAMAVTVLAVAGWALLGSSLLVVRHVRVSGGGRAVSAASVRAAARITPGTPLARVDTAAVTRRVGRLAPVASVRVTRSYPDTVVILVVLRSPALAVARAVSGYVLIDHDGVTVATAAAPPAGLPLLTEPPPQLSGSPGVRAAAAVVGGLPAALASRVRSVSAGAPGVTLVLRSGRTVVWGSPAHAAQKAAEMAALLRTGAAYIDVSDPQYAVTRP